MDGAILRAAAENVQSRSGLYDIENIIRREQGALTLARAYLAEHPADDDLPADSDWLTSVIGESLRDDEVKAWQRFRVLFSVSGDGHDDSEVGIISTCLGKRVGQLSNLTRGEVRRLCKLLNIPLKGAG